MNMSNARTISLPDMEADIQNRATNKDPSFHIEGEWKKHAFDLFGYHVFAVDGKWVRTNLSVIFTHGGHPYVHEFIPMNEIWVGTHHWDEGKYNRCGCSKDNTAVSMEYFVSCAVHEIVECEQMKHGKPYSSSHSKSLKVEKDLGLLKNPNKDDGHKILQLATRFEHLTKGRII